VSVIDNLDGTFTITDTPSWDASHDMSFSLDVEDHGSGINAGGNFTLP
jgi:hypothetical protein